MYLVRNLNPIRIQINGDGRGEKDAGRISLRSRSLL